MEQINQNLQTLAEALNVANGNGGFKNLTDSATALQALQGIAQGINELNEKIKALEANQELKIVE